jgi:succinyl-CoA synthetase beta subunit
MKLFEYEGNQIFRKEGIPAPDFELATTPEEASLRAKKIGFPVVIKAQVLSGGRYLAGGVQTAENSEAVEKAARHILGLTIADYQVKQVMVAPKIEAASEFYVGVTLDEYHSTPIVILSAEGGVSVNQIAVDRPDSVATRSVSITEGLLSSNAKQMAHDVGFRGNELSQVSGIMVTLYKVFRKYDALTAEINPLVQTKNGEFIALDSKIEIDDSSLFRHADLNLSLLDRVPNPLERKGREIGVTYIDMDGDIAVIASGAGLGMASVDIINQKMKPANFLETGGAITADLMYKVMDLIMQKKNLRAIFINVYGGINPIHEGAKGIVKYMKEHNVTLPVVAKALGNRQEETWEIFRSAGVHVVTDVATETAVAELAEILERKA